jgi:hypothetical protein
LGNLQREKRLAVFKCQGYLQREKRLAVFKCQGYLQREKRLAVFKRHLQREKRRAVFKSTARGQKRIEMGEPRVLLYCNTGGHSCRATELPQGDVEAMRARDALIARVNKA